MYKNGKYRETDKMSDLICENYPMVLVMIRRKEYRRGMPSKRCRSLHVPDRRKLSDGRDIRADDKY